MALKVTEINQIELKALIQRVKYAIEHDLALDTDDLRKLLAAIYTLLEVHNRAEQDELTLYKLKKLLGMVTQSERRRDKAKERKKTLKEKQKSPKAKKPKVPAPKPKVEHHKLTAYKSGTVCPHCQLGKLYKYEPGELLRIKGQAPFVATQHVSERLRCNGCSEVVTAPLPKEVLDDGDANQKYGYSARGLMAIQKFYSGVPYNHQSNVNGLMGFHVSASTIFDQNQHLCDAVDAVFVELKRQAADSWHFAIDDTSNRILEQKPELREKPNGKGKQLRTGVYTSGLIAETRSGHEIIAFETSLGHAGEHLDSILAYRAPELPAPIVMSDALSSNSSKHPVEKTFCNSHARRKFYDLKDKAPEEVDWVLEKYGEIWGHEKQAKGSNLSAEERLKYHKKHSLAAMEELHKWATQKNQALDFEEHSGLGIAIKYFLRHYGNLIKFCTIPGVKIDNNRMEERLKIKIRSRKNAHFYRSAKGAKVANTLTSLIATADSNGVNALDYLIQLQKNRVEAGQDPSLWLPWNYEATLAAKQAREKPS